jgi:hypothetical protein
MNPLRDYQEFRAEWGMIGAKEPDDANAQEPRLADAVLDQLLAGADPNTVSTPNGLLTI